MTDETALYLRVRGNVVRVNGRSAVVGRSATCDVQIDEQGVSRRHCEVLLRDDGASVRDLGSSRGTWLGARRIDAEERLTAGVIVTLGPRGPHFELVNAIVRGGPVLGGAAAAPETAEVRRAAAPAAAPPVAPRGPNRFLAGLAVGLVLGLAAGAAVAALVELPF